MKAMLALVILFSMLVSAPAQEFDRSVFARFPKAQVDLVEKDWDKLTGEARVMLAGLKDRSVLDVYKDISAYLFDSKDADMPSVFRILISPIFQTDEVIGHIASQEVLSVGTTGRAEVELLVRHGVPKGNKNAARLIIYNKSQDRTTRARHGSACTLLPVSRRLGILTEWLLTPGDKPISDYTRFRDHLLSIATAEAIKDVDYTKPDAAEKLKDIRDRLIAPIAEALNAPLLAGLEKSLIPFGVNAPAYDRAPLVAEGEAAKTEILTGKSSVNVASVQLLLGSAGYAEFKKAVDEMRKDVP